MTIKDQEKNTIPVIFLDYHISKKCVNLLESYGEICVKCGKCGRKFNNQGGLINPNLTAVFLKNK